MRHDLHRTIVVVLVLLTALSLIACGSTAVIGPTSTVKSISIQSPPPDFQKLTLLVGQTAQLKAFATYTDNSVKNVTNEPGIRWFSGAPPFATVDQSGMVTAVKQGNLIIGADFGGKQATPLGMTVLPASGELIWVASIEVTAPTTQLKVGEKVQFTVTATYSDGSKRDVTSGQGVAWSSSAPPFATVDQSGMVTAVKQGSLQINAVLQDQHEHLLITVVP